MSHSTDKPIEVIIFPLDSSDEKRQFLYQLLSDDEIQRAARFRFDKHRNRFITGRGSIREILADKGNCSPRAIEFELNKYGKPSVFKPESVRWMQFNASSSATMGAIAISKGIAVGLDIEKIKSDNKWDYDLIVKNEFTIDEYVWYKKHRDSDRIRVFFELWTCKEAYLKALGLGLSGGLDSFTINLEGPEPQVSQTTLEKGEQSGLLLHRLSINDGYVACLALPEKTGRIDLSYW